MRPIVPVSAPPAAAVRVCAGALKRCNPGVGVSGDSGHHRVSRRRLRTCDCHGASSRRPGEPCRCCLRPRRHPARAVSSQRVCRVRVLLRSKRRPCVAGSLLRGRGWRRQRCRKRRLRSRRGSILWRWRGRCERCVLLADLAVSEGADVEGVVGQVDQGLLARPNAVQAPGQVPLANSARGEAVVGVEVPASASALFHAATAPPPSGRAAP